MRWQRWFAAVAWLGLLLAVVSLWLQFQLGVYRTRAWLWVPPAMIGLLCSSASFCRGVVSTLAGPGRIAAARWLLIGTLPLLLAAATVGYMFYEQSRKNLPDNTVHKIGRMASVTLLEWDAVRRYPNCLETERVVMYYDDRVTDPVGDAVAIDAHLARLETTLGEKQRFKIHWVRGSSLGMRGMCIHSETLGSEKSPASSVDRHELAHAFLYQFSDSRSEPPMLLLEGWAMAVDRHTEPLLSTALNARKDFRVWRQTDFCLRSLLAADLYHSGLNFAYDIGGAFVDFLLRRDGPSKFIELYNGIHPDNIDVECLKLFACNLDELERQFWLDVEERLPVEVASKSVDTWADMLERQPNFRSSEREQRTVSLLRALTPAERLAVLKRDRLERLPILADEVGLPLDVCRQILAEVAWQRTTGIGETPPGKDK
jgi:hypothetical protein